MFEDISDFRHEHKYIETEVNLIGAESRLRTLMSYDRNADERGYYSVRSLYFDAHDDRFLREKIDGADECEKWRIRIYNKDAGLIRIERKIRKSDLSAKHSCDISREDFDGIMTKKLQINRDNPPLLNVFITRMRTCGLRPAVIVEYERTPFVCRNTNTRITIDRNIRSSSEMDSFLSDGQLHSRPVLESGFNLLEVKYDAFLPVHISHAVEHGRMRRETFSKYTLARRFPYNGRH